MESSVDNALVSRVGKLLITVIVAFRRFRLSPIRNFLTIKPLMSSHEVCNNNVCFVHTNNVGAMNMMEFVFIVKLEMEHQSMFQLRTLPTILQACKPSSTISIRTAILCEDTWERLSLQRNRRVNKSSVEDLVLIPSESEGIPDKMYDVPLYENTTPLNALNEHSEIIVNSDDDNSSSDDDSPYGEDIDYVDASPPDVEIVSLEVVEIVDPEVGRIDDDILLTIKDNTLREKLLNVNVLIAKIDALTDNPTHLEVIEPDPGDLTSIDPGIRKNVSTTNVNVPLEDDQSSLFAYVVWIFLAFLTYPVVPPYLLSCGNEDTIFDPGISIYHSFMPDVSHRNRTFMKFNVYPNRLNESPIMILSPTCSPMDQ
ncbi:hypothetical protein Tco_1118251 [Tanacetum coccineum]